MPGTRIRLGMEVQDKITHFQGIATSRTIYLNACDRYLVTPPVGEDGKLPESEAFDEPDLIIISDGVYVKPGPAPGGPHPVAAREAFPSRNRR